VGGARLRSLTSEDMAQRAESLGEFMIAAPALLDRYLDTRDCPEGVAVTRAAVDRRRAGLVRPAPGEALEALYEIHLNGPVDTERFQRGLRWATAPIYASVALLQGRTHYEPYDYVAAWDTRPIAEQTFTRIVEQFATAEELGSTVGIAAIARDELDRAETAFRAADARDDANGAFNLGVLLRSSVTPIQKPKRLLAGPSVAVTLTARSTSVPSYLSSRHG
jgi:hypothetical protein